MTITPIRLQTQPPRNQILASRSADYDPSDGSFGQSKLEDIAALRVEQYKIQRVRAAAPATVNREIALLKHMYNPADAWDEVPFRE